MRRSPTGDELLRRGPSSAPNYLEIVGGSNFGLTNDYWPNWPNGGCVDHAPAARVALTLSRRLPLRADNPVVATATSSSQCNGEIAISGTPAPNNCALYNYPAAYFTPKSIAHQLVQRGMSWKSYQEGLPSVSPASTGSTTRTALTRT